MSDIKPTTNSTMPDRLYGEHYPDSFLYVSGSIRDSDVATLGDYIRHLQEVDKQSNQPNVANQPIESSFEHICPNNPILTCNCTDPKYCAELGNDPDGNSANTKHDGFSDNLDYTGIPAPQRKNTLVGWPCVVVGAFSETWNTAAECVSGSEHSAGHTEQRTDAGLDNDGPAATTKL
jgi:hypothetical protein